MTICSRGKGRLLIKFDAANKRLPNGTTAVHDLSLGSALASRWSMVFGVLVAAAAGDTFLAGRVGYVVALGGTGLIASFLYFAILPAQVPAGEYGGAGTTRRSPHAAAAARKPATGRRGPPPSDPPRPAEEGG
ncbi:hypothetical protein [Streptomyces sp. NBC_00057]|uniref:hypothetical protein n=1 Tax=Streptomyces sp. NBC_00057 TaxID=2975634 RepID=UPI0032495854